MVDSHLSDNTFADLVEGRLAQGVASSLEHHLDRCPECREFLADLLRASGTQDSGGKNRGVLLPPGTKLGRYVLVERLGAGGMGLVYAADDPELRRQVAIKVLRGGSDPQRLLREAQAMAQIQSRHVVSVYDVGQFYGQVFVAMELIQGETLRTYVKGRSQKEILSAYLGAGRGLLSAHQAGLVHGDFKPDNVLVRAADGEILVADFGLSHFSGAAGEIGGTPAYMAPEVQAGQRGDERADQYSFCVSLWEALTGERPLRGKLPGRLRRILQVGLLTDPKHRYSSLEELLDGLERWRRRSRFFWPILLVLVGVSLVLSILLEHPVVRCRIAGARDRSLYGQEQQRALQKALLAQRVPEKTVRAVHTHLERYFASYAAMSTEVCLAGRRGEESWSLSMRRSDCLYQRAKEADALLRTLGTSGDGALEAVEGLGEISWCKGPALGQGRLPFAHQKTQVDALRFRLQLVSAKVQSGIWKAALPEARALLAETQALGYRPLLAEAHLILGQVLGRAGEIQAAAHSLDQAAAFAMAEGLDVLSAKAWIEEVYVLGYHGSEPARTEAAGLHASAAIERAGEDGSLRSRLLRNLGVRAAAIGKPKEAERLFRQAMVLHKAVPDALNLALLHNDLGSSLASQARFAESLVEHQESLTRSQQLLGEDHPKLVAILSNLANALDNLGRSREAIPLFRKALSIEERAGQGSSLQAARILENLAMALSGPDELAESERLLRRALVISESLLSPTHRQIAGILTNLAGILNEEGRSTQAEGFYHRALSIEEVRLGKTHEELAPIFNGIARCRLQAGKPLEAMRWFERALSVRQKDDPRLAFTYEGMGEAHLALAKPKAVWYLERAIQLFDKLGDHRSQKEAQRYLEQARGNKAVPATR